MKQRLPNRQVLVPLAVLGLIVASLGASLTDLDASVVSLQTLPPCTTLGDSAGASRVAERDTTELTASSTIAGDPGDDTTTSTSDPDASTTTTSDPDDGSTTTTVGATTTTTTTAGATTTSDPSGTTTTSEPPEPTTTTTIVDTTATGACSPGTTGSQDTTTTTSFGFGTSTTAQGGGGPSVAILDRAKQATSTLRVGKWEQAFTATGQLQKTFVDLDVDSFHVRVVDAAANTPDQRDKVRITLRTDSADNAYDDGPVALDLLETEVNSGRFDSKPLLLVSNRADDEAPTDSNATDPTGKTPIKDNEDNDRSFLVALGAKVTATYKQASATADVPARATVKLHLTALTNKDGMPLVGEPFLDNKPYNGVWDRGEDYRDLDNNQGWTRHLGKDKFQQRVEHDLRHANEAFAQVGIRVVPTNPKQPVAYQVAPPPLELGGFAVGKGRFGINKLTPRGAGAAQQRELVHAHDEWGGRHRGVLRPHHPRQERQQSGGAGGRVRRLGVRQRGLQGLRHQPPVHRQPGGVELVAPGHPGPRGLHILAQVPGHIGKETDPFKPNLMAEGPQHVPVLDTKLKVTDSRRLTSGQASGINKRYLNN
jgi:hypothetical protein